LERVISGIAGRIESSGITVFIAGMKLNVPVVI